MLKFAATLLLGASACARSMHGVPTTEAHAHHDGLPEQLGKVSFPISCVPEVQQQFERGVALLHSFGYEEAEKQFRNIASEDPQCAIAHWGIAMTLFHQIWERPQENAPRCGWEELQAAEKIGARSERERSYISALDEFYRDSSSRDHLTRSQPVQRPLGGRPISRARARPRESEDIPWPAVEELRRRPELGSSISQAKRP